MSDGHWGRREFDAEAFAERVRQSLHDESVHVAVDHPLLNGDMVDNLPIESNLSFRDRLYIWLYRQWLRIKLRIRMWP